MSLPTKVYNVSGDYIITCANGDGTFEVNAANILFNGNVTTIANSITSDDFITIAANNTGVLTSMGILGQTSTTTFAGLRFNTTANQWQISSSVTSSGAAIAPYLPIVAGNLQAGGSNTQVQFNNQGLFGGTTGLTFDYTSNRLGVAGNVVASNVNTTGLSLSGNVLSVLNSTSNIATTANIVADYYIGNGSQLTGIDSSTIQNGQSNVKVYANGNITTSVSGTANVVVVTATGEYVTGLISATGNILADPSSYFIGNGSQLTGVAATTATALTNGNTDFTTAPSGNANITIDGTSNVVVFTSTGEYVTGLISATGNVTGGNLLVQSNGALASPDSSITFDSLGQMILYPGYVTSAGNLDFYTNNGFGNYSELWLQDSGNAIINTQGGAQSWVFDTAGNLTAAGNLLILANTGIASPDTSITFDSFGQIVLHPGFVTSEGNLDFYTNNGTGNYSELWLHNLGNVEINTQGGAYSWVFDTTGNLSIPNTALVSNISAGPANSNITITPTGTGVVLINATTGLVLPVGTTAQQPNPATTGTTRFNTDIGLAEIYNGNTWAPFSAPVTNQTLDGNGSTYTFTLNRSTTTAAVLIMLNGITQVPDQAYAMTPSPSNNLVFTEAPGSGDIIDIRFL